MGDFLLEGYSLEWMTFHEHNYTIEQSKDEQYVVILNVVIFTFEADLYIFLVVTKQIYRCTVRLRMYRLFTEPFCCTIH